MTTIVTRAEKGSPLSFVEVDGNFINLNTAKVEGPGVSVDGEIVLFDSTSGALLKRANITGLIKAASGVAAAAVADTDYLSPPSGTSLLKANSGGALANAVAGTDYIAPGGALGTPSSVNLTNATDLPISTGVSGLGTGIAAALAINVGSSGAPIVNGGALGTPSSATLTNATGLPVSTGVSGLGTGVATALAVNVGSSGAPVVNGGALGTPSSGTLTNATDLPIGTGVSGLGTGVAAALAVNVGSSGAPIVNGGALGTPSSGTLSGCTVDGTDSVGFRNVPINSQSAAYTTVLADSGKTILHPSTDANARTFTIDSNANVAYELGTAITFVNMASQTVTIAITSDTMYLAGPGSTGNRSLAQYGMATAVKLTSTTWIISGNGLT
jgi:hypothetical protein